MHTKCHGSATLIRQSLPPDSLLEMDCSVEEGQLAWWTTAACHPIVHREAGLWILIFSFLSKCVLSTNRNILYVDRTLVRMPISTISKIRSSKTKLKAHISRENSKKVMAV